MEVEVENLVPPPLPGGDEHPERGDAPFERCPVTDTNLHYLAYHVLLHEAGHALGIRRENSGQTDFEDSHPFERGLPESVMTYADEGKICSPLPFDVLAMHAMYQSRQRNAN